jgi:hypothetical protein
MVNADMAEEALTIRVQVHPNARRNELQGEKDGAWQLRIAAPPVKGRANQELISYLSRVLQVSQSALTIEKGLTGKRKLIAVSGLSAEQVRARFLKSAGDVR